MSINLEDKIIPNGYADNEIFKRYELTTDRTKERDNSKILT